MGGGTLLRKFLPDFTFRFTTLKEIFEVFSTTSVVILTIPNASNGQNRRFEHTTLFPQKVHDEFEEELRQNQFYVPKY